jgi:adenylosuccinate lyase
MAAVIGRYTRPELGAIWTDEARMTAWRDVEVAAAEALDGPTPEDLDAIRAATFTVDAVKEREKVTTTSRRSSTCWRRRPGRPGAGSTSA